ncbi:eukaryotic translation initiation factor 5B isoform X3 [Glossina fuscipes]|uniref:Eukaryotic translation initiation factor 5B isoform X3 n=1 Tax=Glossina fuscipes TaxID=7396 RepID=A0A9C5Z916_9MUSC|nr:eukaryotic translation initiation factor 5B isoform X3 [Glossina fuscipes]
MPFVAPKSTASAAASRTTSRPPWVKEDGSTGLKPTAKTTVPWARKTNEEKENTVTSSKPTTSAPNKVTESSVSKKTSEPNNTLKREPQINTNFREPHKPEITPAIKKEPESKKLLTSTNNTTATKIATNKATSTPKKEPSPSSSEEEEETEEETEEEEDSEDVEESDESDESEDEPPPPPVKSIPQAKLSAAKPASSKTTTTTAATSNASTKSPKGEEEEIPAPPPLPSLIPKAPPPPPPPGAPGDKKNLTPSQKATIERLRTRPRKRPDWSEMMKEVETGKRLRHVECNDRSQPILTCKSMTKVDNKFIYETEKENSHNKLLKQIQGGIKLKPTQTNDRSKPFLEGLRKFRRQMTIEEQLQKSQSKINILSASNNTDVTDGAALSAGSSASCIVNALSVDDPSSDELDDIDKIRDDLQSTKQMLALELRNREAQERENKKLLAKIATLEAELEREKSREKTLEYGSRIIVATMETTPASEQAYLDSLKQEAEEARTTAKDLEKKYHETGEMLDQAKSEIDEQKRQIQLLERKLAQVLQPNASPDGFTNTKQFHFRYPYEDADEYITFYYQNQNGQGGGLDSRRASDAHNGRDSASDLDLAEFSASDPDEPEEKKNERRQRRLIKEVKVLRSKLTKLKVKQEAAKKEKEALKQAMKKNHVILKEENKKFKKLEKEVHKMAASMKGEEDEDDEEKEAEGTEEAEEEESEDESEESEESESEESEAETESESEPEDASNESKKENLEPRVKKHESRFSAMKKCNVLLQANVDNLQDKITQVRSKAANLQSELDAVLADLGF